MSASMFTNANDHKQFIEIIESIDACKRQHGLSEETVRLTAEMATGDIETCTNKQCGAEVLVLMKDFDNGGPSQYKECPSTGNIFCKDCMEQAQRIDGCECTFPPLIYLPNCEQCPWCKGVPIGNCSCFQGGCDSCSVKWCSECYYNSPWNECLGCNKNLCCDCGKWEVCPSDYYCPKCKHDEGPPRKRAKT